MDIEKNAIWSLMLGNGYLKVSDSRTVETSDGWDHVYGVSVTNLEVLIMLKKMVRSWFTSSSSKILTRGKKPSEAKEPERFYHGFVLGLIVDLEDRYQITSNLESGFGRYDVVVESKEKADPAIIMEFKIQDQDEKDLPQTVEVALSQIETKNYASVLTGKGMQPEGNRKYVFAFRGKENKNQRNERI
ncbi:PD-(D/E)XK nuclease domain-containing protein [Sellimonas intestinalis]|uniref:PD-(D/E)XK nuclease domain-containing protein n=1 Tax=Sellimonas intestinalis TaxID=1653434 RepID=UPI00399FBC57